MAEPGSLRWEIASRVLWSEAVDMAAAADIRALVDSLTRGVCRWFDEHGPRETEAAPAPSLATITEAVGERCPDCGKVCYDLTAHAVLDH
jgi:hypothetical protein